MKYVISFLLAWVAFLSAGAQPSAGNFGKVWVNGVGVSFVSKFTSNGVVNQYLDTFYSPAFTRGQSNICDSFGHLLLCSDGANLYNSNADLIDQGDTLIPTAFYNANYGFNDFAQASIILPFKNKKYYLITGTFSDDGYNAHLGYFDLLLYHIVDMNANNGAGKVVRRMVPLMQNAKLSRVQMVACKHANGLDWWLLKQGHDSNIIYKFLFKQDTVLSYPPQYFSSPAFGWNSLAGQSAFTQDGTKYATTCRGAKKLFVADFDRCSGDLTNPQVYDVPVAKTHNPGDTSQTEPWTESLAFSPNGHMLYVGKYFNIQQLDLTDPNPNTAWTNVAGLDTSWAAFQQYSNLALGVDGKLYIGNWNGLCAQMSVINNPDAKGTACDFCPKCLRFPEFHFSPTLIGAGVNTPPNMPNYALGSSNPICFPAAITPVKAAADFGLYPNPAGNRVTVTYHFNASETGTLVLYDQLGRVVKTSLLPGGQQQYQVPLNELNPGLYYYNFIVDGRPKQAGKLVIE